MSDWGLAQGAQPVQPFYHDPLVLCDDDCDRDQCRWLNCGCEGHIQAKDRR